MVTQSARGVLFEHRLLLGRHQRLPDLQRRDAARLSEGLKQLTKATILLVPLVAFSSFRGVMRETSTKRATSVKRRATTSSSPCSRILRILRLVSASSRVTPASLEYAMVPGSGSIYLLQLVPLLGDPPALPQGVIMTSTSPVEGVLRATSTRSIADSLDPPARLVGRCCWRLVGATSCSCFCSAEAALARRGLHRQRETGVFVTSLSFQFARTTVHTQRLQRCG